MLGTLSCLRCQPAVRSRPTVGHTLHSGRGRQSGRLRASSQRAQLELEVKLLRQAVDAERRAANEARLRADEVRRAADLQEQSLRTELAFVRGTLNMRGVIGAC